jgi:hypothetical protein
LSPERANNALTTCANALTPSKLFCRTRQPHCCRPLKLTRNDARRASEDPNKWGPGDTKLSGQACRVGPDPAAAWRSEELHQFLQGPVRGGDHPGVGLIGPLALDHVDELVFKVHITLLEREGD